MPRKPRFFVPGVPSHVIQRGNNRDPVFLTDNDYRVYLKWLKEALIKHQCALHAYVLMTNHIHFLITPTTKVDIGLMMQYIASEDDEHQSSLLEEAEAIGTQYGQDLHTAGLPLTDALQATMFFRDNIVESAVMLPSSVRQRPESNKRLLRRINEFLNAMQLAIATAYDPSDE